MVEGYLMNAQTFVGRIVNFLNFNNSDYFVYVPNEKVVLGYFVNKKDLDFSSKDLFCKSLDHEKASKFGKDITKKRFVRKVNIDNKSLEHMLEIGDDIESLKESFHSHFLMLRDKLHD